MPDNALPARSAAVLTGLLLALLLLRLGDTPLLGPDEPRYARVAVEMSRSGELVTPTLQGEPWLEKPALYYWLASTAFAVLGETETAARLPSVAAALALAGFSAIFAARLFGGPTGFHAGLVAGTSLLGFAYGRAAAMDMLLAASVTGSIALFGLRLLGIAGRLAVPAAWALAGVAVLAKGPLGLLLPLLVVGGFLALTRDGRAARELLRPWGPIAFVCVAGPWYAAVLAAQGWRFVEVFLLNHNLQRFTSTIHNHPGPFWYYLPVLLAGVFPWSGILLPALLTASPRRERADLFLLTWLGLPLVFFSAAGSKLPGYVLPCLPPLAILAGRSLLRLATDSDAGRTRAWSRPAALVGLVLGALIFTAPFLLRGQGEPAWASALPSAAWALTIAFLVSRRILAAPAATLALLRVGAVGLPVLLTLAAPELLAARESGRDLFAPARGREVLAWNAWRTAWMAGYFYNDGRVREVQGFPEIARRLAEGPALVLCGPAERARLARDASIEALVLAEGPRRNVLLELARR
ncbi:MAG: glycosyltransferase family 39 protein [Vicinamibacteria bacterium]